MPLSPVRPASVEPIRPFGCLIPEVKDPTARTDEGGRLAELYRRHGPEAVRLAYVMTRDRALAEDLAQEAFVRITGRFAHLRHPEAFQAYLRRTVVNLVRNHARRQRLERAHLDLERRGDAPGAGEVDLDMNEALRTAVLRLPHRQRAAVVLRFFEDLSERQTGEVLRCRPGTVKSLVSRAMATLRADLGPSYAGQVEAEREESR